MSAEDARGCLGPPVPDDDLGIGARGQDLLVIVAQADAAARPVLVRGDDLQGLIVDDIVHNNVAVLGGGEMEAVFGQHTPLGLEAYTTCTRRLTREQAGITQLVFILVGEY